MVGPVFRLVNTIGRSASAATGLHTDLTTSVLAGSQRRLFIAADSGQPFEVTVSAGSTQPVLAFVHEPGGMPLRGAEPQVAAAGDPAGVTFRLDGRDVIGGLYEVVAVAPPASKSAASFSITGAAFAFDAKREPGGVVVRVKGPSEAGERNVSLNLVGAERMVRLVAHGSDSAATPFVVPGWATHATLCCGEVPQCVLVLGIQREDFPCTGRQRLPVFSVKGLVGLVKKLLNAPLQPIAYHVIPLADGRLSLAIPGTMNTP